MKSLNKVQLIGRLATEIELKETQTNKSFATFTIALNRTIKREGTLEKTAEFYRIKAWNSLAKLCQKYMTKGMPVYVEGTLSISDYEDKNGIQRRNVEILANDINFLPSYNLAQKAEAC